MMALPFPGGSATGLSATDAWRRAAVGDAGQRNTANDVPGKLGQLISSNLRCSATVPNYGHYVAYAYPPGLCGGDTRSGGGLGEMIRRKSENVRLRNERDFPYLVELALPPGAFAVSY